MLKECFSEERLKIPSNGKIGLWKITITSGSNLEKIEFNVFSEMKEGMIVKTTERSIAGDLLRIDIVASHKTSIQIEIFNDEEKKVQELMCNTTKEFKCETFWSIPKDTIPGTYTIKAYDAISSSETTFKVITK